MLRRDVLAGIATAVACMSSRGGGAARAAPEIGRVSRTATRIAGFASEELDFQLMRSLGAANSGGAAVGEVFAIRKSIPDDDPSAWPPAFAAMASRVVGRADAARTARHPISAREHYWRASMYYRAAEYFADPFGPDITPWGLASRAAFLSGAQLSADRIEAIDIPFEGANLPGYFMRPAAGAREGRTLVVLTGFDGTGEELYFEVAAAGLARGYNIFIGEGPGQAGTMRVHPELKFRPDYEKPIGAMLDVALAQKGVAAERLGLYGISFGGYFVTRAAEHDARIKALIVNSPIVDLFSYMAGAVGPKLAQRPPPVTLADIDKVSDAAFSPTAKLGFKSACRRFGVDSFAGWMARAKDFNAEHRLAAIRCPSLPMVGAGEGSEARAQFERFARSVTGPVTRRVFEVEDGADMHCQFGNLPLSNAAVFDWLDALWGAA